MAIIGDFPCVARASIPAHIGFQATAGDNTLHLRTQTNGYKCTIDWGDGSETIAPVNGGNIIHNYANAGLYDIKIRGRSFAGFSVNNQAGKEKYVAAYSMGKWAVDTLTTCDMCFHGCENLAYIDAKLFANNPKITDFGGCFRLCDGLTTIPSDLFRYNTLVTTFGSCFYGCTSLTTIPTDLFRYNTVATNFFGCFTSCTNLTTVPADLFRYNTLAINFTDCFYRCSSLTTIPANLFRYNTAATNFSYCFKGDISLTAIPADLFHYNTAVTNFSGCFTSCSSLTTTPTDLFRYNTAAITFRSCFYSCIKLTLRADIFGTDYVNRFNGKTVDFGSCFVRPSFTGTQGTAPELWRFTGLTATKTSCFGGAGNSATSLSNYASIPADWK